MYLSILSVIGGCVGCLIGIFFGFRIGRNDYDGKLIVDSSDPEKDYYNLQIGVPLDDIPKKKRLNLKVELLDYDRNKNIDYDET